MCELANAIVFDCGSITCRIGFGSEDDPKVVFPTIIDEDGSIGNEAYKKLGEINLRRPIIKSMVNNWDDLELLYQHGYSQLGAQSENFGVLVTEPHHNSKQNREKTFEMMFETFKVPSMQMISQTVLAMYSNGRTTGIVLDSGDGPTHIVPIYDGYADSYGVTRLPFGGFELTSYLMELLNESGQHFSGKTDREMIRELKEKECYMAMDKNDETNRPLNSSYQLPDGRHVKVGSETFICPEALFQPGVLDLDADGIHKALFKSIQKCDVSIRKDMYSNIVLAGGNTMLSGFFDRLNKEIVALAPPQINIKIIASDTRYYSAWLGGSVLASVGSFSNSSITKQQYEDSGSSIIHSSVYSK